MPDFTPIVNPKAEFGFFDDFFNLDTRWTAVNDGGSGTNTVNGAAGGTYSVVTAAADNDYHFIVGTKCYKMLPYKSIIMSAKVTCTEANTDDANIIFGLSSDVAATALGADGAGPPANYSGILFFKVDGGTVWQTETSVGTTQTTTSSAATFTSGTSYELEAVYESVNATVSKVHFYINGTLVASHQVTISSAALMGPIIGIKAGAGNAETLIIDYVGVRQSR